LSAAITGGRIVIRSAPENEAAALPLPHWTTGNSAGGDFDAIAYFRSEAAELAPKDAGASEPGLALFGRVNAVSYPGGTWRHALQVGETEIQVDAEVAYPPGSEVRILVPPAATFLFRADDVDAGEPDAAPARRAAGSH
jgi:hypothetical protein